MRLDLYVIIKVPMCNLDIGSMLTKGVFKNLIIEYKQLVLIQLHRIALSFGCAYVWNILGEHVIVHIQLSP